MGQTTLEEGAVAEEGLMGGLPGPLGAFFLGGIPLQSATCW